MARAWRAEPDGLVLPAHAPHGVEVGNQPWRDEHRLAAGELGVVDTAAAHEFVLQLPGQRGLVVGLHVARHHRVAAPADRDVERRSRLACVGQAGGEADLLDELLGGERCGDRSARPRAASRCRGDLRRRRGAPAWVAWRLADPIGRAESVQAMADVAGRGPPRPTLHPSPGAGATLAACATRRDVLEPWRGGARRQPRARRAAERPGAAADPAARRHRVHRTAAGSRRARRRPLGVDAQPWPAHAEPERRRLRARRSAARRSLAARRLRQPRRQALGRRRRHGHQPAAGRAKRSRRCAAPRIASCTCRRPACSCRT